MRFSKEATLLAEIVNYSLKGVTGALGRGEGITKYMQPVSFHVKEGSVTSDFIQSLTATNLIEDGDAIVIPSKVAAILENRLVYGLTVENYKACVEDINYARKHLKTADNKPLTAKDLIGLDKIDPQRKVGSRYPEDPNALACEIAQGVEKQLGTKIDVVISDSDAGGKKGIHLIDCPTIIATPIGATAGLRFFYCMRLALAAEMTWNNEKDIPVLLIKPYQEYRLRERMGELRYSGFLSGGKEEDVLSIINE